MMPTVADTDDVYADLIKDVSVRPFFIMGDHRSGTTLLYRLLHQSGCFNVVQAYHIMKHQDLLANHLQQREAIERERINVYLHQVGMIDRRLDETAASAELPEEYGFVLNDGFRRQLSERNLSHFVDFCRKVQFVTDPRKPLLLKNPWDFMNTCFVKAAFPETKFIFLHRHPVQRINSQIKAARTLYTTKSHYHALLDSRYDRLWQRPLPLKLTQFLFSPHFDMGFRLARRHMMRATTYFLKHIPHLSQDSYISVRFEDLCTDTEQVLEQILTFLGLEVEDNGDYTAVIKPRQSPLLEVVCRHQETILKQMEPYLAYCHYKEEARL